MIKSQLRGRSQSGPCRTWFCDSAKPAPNVILWHVLGLWSLGPWMRPVVQALEWKSAKYFSSKIGAHFWDPWSSLSEGSFFVATIRQPKYLSSAERIGKRWYIHTVEYCFAIKRKSVSIHIAPWVNLKGIVQSERSQTQKNTCCGIPFISSIQKRQIQRDRK